MYVFEGNTFGHIYSWNNFLETAMPLKQLKKSHPIYIMRGRQREVFNRNNKFSMKPPMLSNI